MLQRLLLAQSHWRPYRRFCIDHLATTFRRYTCQYRSLASDRGSHPPLRPYRFLGERALDRLNALPLMRKNRRCQWQEPVPSDSADRRYGLLLWQNWSQGDSFPMLSAERVTDHIHGW